VQLLLPLLRRKAGRCHSVRPRALPSGGGHGAVRVCACDACVRRAARR
jgi:hypothetical protein